ncbi:hypothetical protein VKT23_003127 [Stygiomarasmius scandens]|uniref:SH3 domain-containing protein n=1 Tax=Marasmiellus scandens TaxID=2682957 RepID=A0ABR1JY11_9AGAR
MPKFNSPLPQPLPKECAKAAKIFRSFVDSGNNGLDGVIPRSIIENAKGFAIFTIFKAGFLFSARAGTGVVIAKLPDGTWSAPSAIGTAGIGLGGQAGAEMTDFLIVLNSKSAIKSFMAAGSLTLGGNASIAIGPLGRNGEATGALNTNGKVAAMYSYSKTRGLFGGISIEGSVIVERQDANVQAYQNDQVSVKLLLSGAITPPPWAKVLTDTIEACTGLPGNRRWVQDGPSLSPSGDYAFGGVASPGAITPNSMNRKLKKDKSPYPPPSWGEQKEGGSYFNSTDSLHFGTPRNGTTPSSTRVEDPWNDSTSRFDTRFESDFLPEEEIRKKAHRMTLSLGNKPSTSTSNDSLDPFNSSSSLGHQRSVSLASPMTRSFPSASLNPFAQPDETLSPPSFSKSNSQPYIAPKPELAKPLLPHEGVGRAIALYDFQAAEPGDLGFNKGEVIVITEKSDSIDDWWTGKIGERKGIFPANFVEVV